MLFAEAFSLSERVFDLSWKTLILNDTSVVTHPIRLALNFLSSSTLVRKVSTVLQSILAAFFEVNLSILSLIGHFEELSQYRPTQPDDHKLQRKNGSRKNRPNWVHSEQLEVRLHLLQHLYHKFTPVAPRAFTSLSTCLASSGVIISFALAGNLMPSVSLV